MYTLLNRAVLLTAICMLAGCAATINKPEGYAQAGQEITVSSAAAKKIALLLTGTETITSSADWPAFSEEWKTSMTDATASSGVGFTLLQGTNPVPTDTGTLVKVTVNDFRYMSQAKRYLVGVLAGNAYMDLTVDFFELPSKKPLGTRKYNTSTRGGQGIFSAATPKQVEAVSAEIVREVRGSTPDR